MAIFVLGQGTQFITGPCATDADCASGCCSFLRGVCAGPVIAQERASDGGCGHGNATPNNNAALAFFSSQAAAAAGQPTTMAIAMTHVGTPATPAANPEAEATGFTNPAGAGNKAGKQFITGVCTSDSDCASGCCSFLRGVCAGAIVATERASDGGCGFGDATPNSNAAQALQGGQ